MATEFPEFMARFAAALLAGALVGLERERARVKSAKAKELPGLRSFGLLSAYGAVTGYLMSRVPSAWPYSLALAVGFVVIVAAYTIYRLFATRVAGVTTPIVMLLVYCLGFAAGLGFIVESVAASAMITLILALKTPIARVVKAISYEELLAIFELALFYLALAPLVYSVNIQFLGISLATVYTFFLLVLSVNFASYIAWRLGVTPPLYALLGGIVVSEGAAALIAKQAGGRCDVVRCLLPYVLVGMQFKTAIIALAAIAVFGRLDLMYETAPWLILPLAATIVALLFSVCPLKEPVELREVTPLDMKVVAKTVLVYLGLLVAAALLKPVLARPEALLLYAVSGGLVSATATIFALVAYLPHDPLLYAQAFAAAIAAATLNKPIYVRSVDPKLARVTLNVSLVFAIPYAVAAIASLAARWLM